MQRLGKDYKNQKEWDPVSLQCLVLSMAGMTYLLTEEGNQVYRSPSGPTIKKEPHPPDGAPPGDKPAIATPETPKPASQAREEKQEKGAMPGVTITGVVLSKSTMLKDCRTRSPILSTQLRAHKNPRLNTPHVWQSLY